MTNPLSLSALPGGCAGLGWEPFIDGCARGGKDGGKAAAGSEQAAGARRLACIHRSLPTGGWQHCG